MARGRVTGIVLDGDRLEWATLVQSGDRVRRVDQGLELLAAEAAPGSDAPAMTRQAIVDRIREACAGMKGDIALGLTSDATLLRVVDLPAVDAEELTEMAALQADKFSPFPIEVMAVSHEVLARSEDGCRVLVAAARDDAVEAQGGLLVEAGVRPTVIDSSALGWWRLLKESGSVPSEGRAALVLMSGDRADLIVVQDAIPLVFRTIDVEPGGAAASVAADIGQALNHTLISMELEHGSQSCSVGLWAYEEQLQPLAAALTGSGSWEVSAHTLDGLPPLCEGIARRLLSDGGIDLTPQTWLDADAARRTRRLVLGGLGSVLGVWLLCVLGMVGLFGWRSRTINRIRAERARWEQPAMEVRELRRRVLTIDRYTDTSHSSLECLREVSGLQPEGIDLVSFSYTKGDAIRVVGQAEERTLIYSFKEALDASGFFPLIELGSHSQDRRGQHWNFEMTLRLSEGDDEEGESS
ncbi:MAG: pilus assembly protein PilM [Lentisphaerae bacterium]|nr:pilus assembly protein PilM [Lentisphaerota bacterium]